MKKTLRASRESPSRIEIKDSCVCFPQISSHKFKCKLGGENFVVFFPHRLRERRSRDASTKATHATSSIKQKDLQRRNARSEAAAHRHWTPAATVYQHNTTHSIWMQLKPTLFSLFCNRSLYLNLNLWLFIPCYAPKCPHGCMHMWK